MAKVEKGRTGKPSAQKSSKKDSPSPQQLDQGSEESKFRPRLRDMYQERVVPALMKEFGYKNIMQVPKLERVVLNVGKNS